MGHGILLHKWFCITTQIISNSQSPKHFEKGIEKIFENHAACACFMLIDLDDSDDF